MESNKTLSLGLYTNPTSLSPLDVNRKVKKCHLSNDSERNEDLKRGTLGFMIQN